MGRAVLLCCVCFWLAGGAASAQPRSLPDLVVKNSYVQDEFRLVAMIWNAGLAQSGSCFATLILYGPDGREAARYEAVVKALAPNSGERVAFATGGRSLDHATYQVFVDLGKRVSEVNEANNGTRRLLAEWRPPEKSPRKGEPAKQTDSDKEAARKAAEEKAEAASREIDLAVKGVYYKQEGNETRVACAVENRSDRESVAGRKMRFERTAKVGFHNFNLKFAEEVAPRLQPGEVYEWVVERPPSERGAEEYIWKCTLTPADANAQNDTNSFKRTVVKID